MVAVILRFLSLLLLVLIYLCGVHAQTKKQPSAQGLPVAKDLHRHLVMIMKKGSGTAGELGKGKNIFLGCGSVLNSYFVLSTSLAFKNEKSGTPFYVVPGHVNHINKLVSEIKTNELYKFEDDPASKDLQNFKSVVLLKTERPMVFGSDLTDVFFTFNQGPESERRAFTAHCELISYYFDHTKQEFIKTQFSIRLHRVLDSCETKHESEKCIQILLVSDKYTYNPCFENVVNIGAPVMCDVAQEGIFFGYGHGEGCGSHAQMGLRAFLFNEHEPTTTWIYNVIARDIKKKIEENIEDIYYDIPEEKHPQQKHVNITLPPPFNGSDSIITTLFFTPQVTKPPKIIKKKKCSNGDRWRSHLFIVILPIFLFN